MYDQLYECGKHTSCHQSQLAQVIFRFQDIERPEQVAIETDLDRVSGALIFTVPAAATAAAAAAAAAAVFTIYYYLFFTVVVIVQMKAFNQHCSQQLLPLPTAITELIATVKVYCTCKMSGREIPDRLREKWTGCDGPIERRDAFEQLKAPISIRTRNCCRQCHS